MIKVEIDQKTTKDYGLKNCLNFASPGKKEEVIKEKVRRSEKIYEHFKLEKTKSRKRIKKTIIYIL